MSRWFDADSGLLRLDEMVAEQETFRKIMSDGVVTDAELSAQSDRVLTLLHRLDSELDEISGTLVQDTLVELAVLFSATHYHDLQQLEHRVM